MSGIIIAIVVLVVAAIVGFVAFVILYHLKQRRNGMPTSSIIPPADAFKSAFGRGSNNRSGGGGSGSGFGGTFGLGRLGGGGGEERSTRFAALDVDEAWDTHVDEEMGYGQTRAKDQRMQSGRPLSGRMSHEELDDRYEAVMDGADQDEDERNPFGSGSYETRPDSQGSSNRKSAFKEGI